MLLYVLQICGNSSLIQFPVLRENRRISLRRCSLSLARARVELHLEKDEFMKSEHLPNLGHVEYLDEILEAL